ncbi:MAG: helix-turn-helix domain-containing protein [Lachnospiraceae bacterium]
MKDFKHIIDFDNKRSTNVNLPYGQLMNISAIKPDVGIHSEYRNEKLYHVLLHDILITIQQYRVDEYVKASIVSSNAPVNILVEETEIPFHYNDFIQISYIIRGTLTTSIEGQTYKFTENELYFIDRRAYLREVLEESDAIVLNISLQPALFDEMLLTNIKENSLQGFIRQCLLHDKCKRKFLKFSPHDQVDAKELSNYISDIFFESKAQNPGYLYIVKGYLIRLMDYISNCYKPTFDDEKRKKYQEYLFQDIQQYMLLHYRDMQMKDLVQNFHYQTSFFNKLIHEFTGMSYSDYLISIRLRKATELLEGTTLSIEDIMENIGYNNKGFFYKIFKSKNGVTPAQYRKNIKQRK